MLDKKEIQNFIRQFNKKNDSMQTEKLILVAISSAVGGALLGILFAPDKGKNTRKQLAKKRDEYLEEIIKNTEELSQQLKNNTESILGKSKKTLQDLKQDVEDYSELSYQELYDLAKELKVNGYSQMNKSELIQALKD
ncbi:YtxH domain-containing protein [Rhodohalobacter sp. SW132]|uniref:YtxH domain-containing protein n=1 Tax=Rhodohalobacter sp. SW132 TaxID=2293433 RepID=UPI00131510C3|nr:YtxH domain-containing protein [Rhodohalobacter sp. SW132]